MYKSRIPGHYDHYQSTKANLQRQTAALLAQRNQLESRYAINEPPAQKIRQFFSQSANITPVALQKKIDNNKTQEVVNKLQQIIKLCKQEGSLSNQEMREVIKVQNQVLNYLHKANGETEPKIINPHQEQLSYSQSQSKGYSQNQYQYSEYQHEPQFRSLPTQAQQKIVQEPNESQSKIDSPQVIKSKRDVNQGAPTLIPQTWGKEQRSNFFSEDTLQIIAEIQRKALSQIIHLQQERDTVKKERDTLLLQLQKVKGEAASNQQTIMQRVAQEQQKLSRSKAVQIDRLVSENQILKMTASQSERIRKQNKMLREENQALIQRIEHLEVTGYQNGREMRKTDLRETYPEYQQPRSGLAYGQYDSQIAVYQNQLRRATVVINELRSRLANVPGLEELHQQGQKIRRETTELLQMKARGNAATHQSALIRQLQERLQQQERGKVLFLQQLKAFKQKYNELQQQNRVLKKSKVSFDPVPRMASNTPQRQTSPSRGIMKKRNNYFGDYEQTLNEMKRALY